MIEYNMISYEIGSIIMIVAVTTRQEAYAVQPPMSCEHLLLVKQEIDRCHVMHALLD